MRRGSIARWLAIAIVAAAAVYLGIGAVVVTRLTVPAREVAAEAPPDLPFQRVELQARDGTRLAAWWAEPPGATAAAVLVHGKDRSKAAEYVVATARLYLDAGIAVLLPDLRGHGESAAARLSLGQHEAQDVLAALAFLADRGYDPGRVLLHGWSMGAATVLLAAPGTGVAGVVSDSAYANLPLLLRTALPDASGLPAWFNPGIQWMGRLLYGVDVASVLPERGAAALRAEGVPLLIIHGAADETVPIEHARRLLHVYPDADAWFIDSVPGTGEDDPARHVHAYLHPEYPGRLRAFWRKALDLP